jgi:hypothetical protein
MTVFWRDVREVGVAFALALWFLWRGTSHDWAVILACVWIGLFMIVDRVWQRRKRPILNDPLKACLQSSRSEVSHQIWLLRNVLWWYLLPLVLGLAIRLMDPVLRTILSGSPSLSSWVRYLIIWVPVFWGVYWLNQYAVRKHLQPRLQELDALLADLKH